MLMKIDAWLIRHFIETTGVSRPVIAFRDYLHRLIFFKRYTEQESCAIAKMTVRCALYKWIE